METQETMDRVSQVHILLPAAKRAVKKKLMSTPLKTKSVVRRGSVRQDAQNKSTLPYFTASKVSRIPVFHKSNFKENNHVNLVAREDSSEEDENEMPAGAPESSSARRSINREGELPKNGRWNDWATSEHQSAKTTPSPKKNKNVDKEIWRFYEGTTMCRTIYKVSIKMCLEDLP